jgi:hypothetical protein
MRFFLAILSLSTIIADHALAWRCCLSNGKEAQGTFTHQKLCQEKGHLVDPAPFCPLESASLTKAKTNPEAGFIAYLDSRYNTFTPNITASAKCILTTRTSAEQKTGRYHSSHTSKIDNQSKFMSCGISAILKKICGHTRSEISGYIRDVYQLFDKRTGNAFESGDQNAEEKGRDIANRNRSEEDALKACADLY